MPNTTTVGRYLIERLEQSGLQHMFGVPGDYVLDFMDRVVESPIQLIGTCNELNAGYAADAYARLNGIGAVAVTYGVGGLSLVNAVAGAYAERVPLVIISGAPRSSQRMANLRVHHLVTDYGMQLDVFHHLTVDGALLDNPETAPAIIDRVVENCLWHKRPVYIEIPLDMVDANCTRPATPSKHRKHGSDPQALAECVEEASTLLNAAKSPVILAGVELHRFGLAPILLQLIEHMQIPYATTIDGKTVLPEMHPQFMGVYMGALSRPHVREQMETSDGVLSLGVTINDMSSGVFTAHLPEAQFISASMDRIQIKSHYYDHVWIGDFIIALIQKLQPRTYQSSHPRAPYTAKGDFIPKENEPIRPVRFYDRINRFLKDEMILIAETGDAVIGACELHVNEPENFISQSYYLSIGYALPATLGVSLARPQKRPVLLQGDGAFQMTAQELATLLKQRCRPIIFLLNNDGYVIERMIHDGPYNNIPRWKYNRLPDVLGEGALSLEVKTEGELEGALAAAEEAPDRLVFIDVHLPSNEGCAALNRLCTDLRKLQKHG